MQPQQQQQQQLPGPFSQQLPQPQQLSQQFNQQFNQEARQAVQAVQASFPQVQVSQLQQQQQQQQMQGGRMSMPFQPQRQQQAQELPAPAVQQAAAAPQPFMASPTQAYMASVARSQSQFQQQHQQQLQQQQEAQSFQASRHAEFVSGGAPAESSSSQTFMDGMWSRRRDIMKLLVMAMVILLAIAAHWSISHYVKLYLDQLPYASSVWTEVAIRVGYPVAIVLLIWLLKTSFPQRA